MNGSHPDDVLAALEASFDAAYEPLSLAAEGFGLSANLSLYAVSVATEKEKQYLKQCRGERLPKPMPLDTALAADEVLDAASHVEHAYTAGGGWSVPLSLTLRDLQRTVRHLRHLEARDR